MRSKALQSVAERRGETGVGAVRYMEGPQVYKLSPKLLDAALARRVNPPPEDRGQKAEAFQIRYRDGLQASVPQPKCEDTRLSGGRPSPQ